MSDTIYVRVSSDAKKWLDEQSNNTGIPRSKIIDMLLTDAKKRKIHFIVTSPIIMLEGMPENV